MKTTLIEVVRYLDSLAPPLLQESYDNTGIQAGDPAQPVSSVLVTLDVTESVIDEAIASGSDLIVTHHPVIFGNLKRITGATSTERIMRKAIKNDISIVAFHTNLDNIAPGVNAKIAGKIGLKNCTVLRPAKGLLRKLVTFIPARHLEEVSQAVFEAGAGQIGNYDSCSFNAEGTGTFRGNESTHPFAGIPGKFHTEPETRFETVFPVWTEKEVISALLKAHPYEEVAYDVYPLENSFSQVGAGLTGELDSPVDEHSFLNLLKERFHLQAIRHSPLRNQPVTKVAVCGGAGSFLLPDAIAIKADVFVTSDVRYHQFFDAIGKTVLADIGHYESEQFTKELFYELLTKKFPTFAVRLSETITNPVNWFL